MTDSQSENPAPDAQADAITFTFHRRTDADGFTELPDELEVRLASPDVESMGTSLNAALELIHLAPAFDGIDGHELEAALGDTHYAEFSVSEDFATVPLQSGLVTNLNFDVTEPVTRSNTPHMVDDTIETASGTTLTYKDYPTDGLLFHTPDGVRSQISQYDLDALATGEW